MGPTPCICLYVSQIHVDVILEHSCDSLLFSMLVANLLIEARAHVANILCMYSAQQIFVSTWC